jgi:hypothetical protein
MLGGFDVGVFWQPSRYGCHVMVHAVQRPHPNGAQEAHKGKKVPGIPKVGKEAASTSKMQ